MDTFIKTIEQNKTIVKNDIENIKVLPWKGYIYIKKRPTKNIPEDKHLLEEAANYKDLRKALKGSLYEWITSKLIHYYFHFLDHKDQKIKSYFYKKFISLETKLVQMGNEYRFFQDIQTSSRKSHHEAKNFINNIKTMNPDELYKKTTLEYERIKEQYTAYGENISSVLGFLMTNYNVQMY